MADDPNDDPKARFESIRQINPYGEEYWSARDLAPLLGYDKWKCSGDVLNSEVKGEPYHE